MSNFEDVCTPTLSQFFKYCVFQILYDFGIRYPNIESHVFEDFWKTGSGHLRLILNRYYSSNEFSSVWPREIEDFLILPRLLIAKNKSSEVFSKVIDKFIVFRTVLYNIY